MLHASATASSGYGLGRPWLKARAGAQGSWIGSYLLAVRLHAAYNLLVALSAICTDPAEMASPLGLGGAVLLMVCFPLIGRRIQSLDRANCRPPSSS